MSEFTVRGTARGRGRRRREAAWPPRACSSTRGARRDADRPAPGARRARTRSRRSASSWRSAAHPAGLLTGADLVVHQPGRALDQPTVAAARGGGRAGHRRSGAGVALAARARGGHHRHEREVDDDGAHGADARGRRACGRSSAATSAPRSRATSARRRPTTMHVVEVSSFQLETTDTFHPWIAALLNLTAGPPGPPRERRGVRRGESAHLRAADRARLGGGECRRCAGARDGRGAAGARVVRFARDARDRRGRAPWPTAGSCRARPGRRHPARADARRAADRAAPAGRRAGGARPSLARWAPRR